MKKIFIISLVLFLCISCTVNDRIAVFEDQGLAGSIDERDYVEYIDTDAFEAQLTFLGMGSQYFIFECSVENFSSDTIFMYAEDYRMDTGLGKLLSPYTQDELIDLLQHEKSQWKKEKKNRTIWNSIVAGLGVVAAAASGSGVAENVFYSAEPLAFIFEERSFYQRNIKSVEDEMAYVFDMGFEDEVIPPGATLFKDLLFPLQLVTDDVHIVYENDRQSDECWFDERIFKRPR